MRERQVGDDERLPLLFGERLRLLRKAYSDHYGEDLHIKARWARRLRVSQAMYGRWESGKYFPKYVDLLRICVLFRVDPNYLIAGVLSDRLEPWLYRALKADNPELLGTADYWKRQNELYAQANLVTSRDEQLIRDRSPCD
jgi:transcriptional regulator with XRE-family HTH domain